MSALCNIVQLVENATFLCLYKISPPKGQFLPEEIFSIFFILPLAKIPGV